MKIQRLTPADVTAYRAVMLTGYADEPDAFTSTVAERAPLPLDWWAARVAVDPDAAERVFGAFVDDRLVGLAGLSFERRERTSHKSTLFGMYVLPAHRGRGLARALVRAVLEAAASHAGTRVVQLTVTDTNAPAIALYRGCGFVPFGSEPLAVRLADRYVTKVHMWCDVSDGTD